MDKIEKVKKQIREMTIASYPLFLEYVDENKADIERLPKLYFLANGKTGWLDSWSLYCSEHCACIVDNYYIDCRTFEITYGCASYKSKIKSDEDKFRFMRKVINEGALDFKEEIGKLVEQFNQPVEKIIGMVALRDWFKDSISYGFDISYEEYRTYFKGRINEGYDITRQKYNEIVKSMRVEIAKKTLSEKYRINFDVFDTIC